MQSQTITQTINVLVGDTSGSKLADTGANIIVLITLALALIVISVLAVYFITNHKKKVSFGSLGAFAFLTLAGTSLALNLSTVSAVPTLSIATNQTNLDITIPKGGGTASTTTDIATSTLNSTGYKLTAVLQTEEPGIDISLKGGAITNSTPLKANATPLELKTTSTANSASLTDLTAVTLDFTIAGTVKEGKKELKLIYNAVDNSPATDPDPDPDPTPQTMQSMTSAYCSNMTVYDGTNENAIITLTDNRGGISQSYRVAKLADNNCWMLDNLKLGSTSSPITLTNADTNLTNKSSFTLPQLVTTGTADYDNPGAYGPVPGDTGSGATNYGYLYNWPAVTAGETRVSMPAGSGDAPNSICPKNWRLPIGGTYDSGEGEFAALDRAFGGNGMHQYNGEPNIAKWNYNGPFKGVLSGYWYGSFSDQSSWGYLWSRSASPDYSYYALSASLYPDYVFPGSNDNRNNGFAVRCLL